MTIEEWSRTIARPGEFFAAQKVTVIRPGGKDNDGRSESDDKEGD